MENLGCQSSSGVLIGQKNVLKDVKIPLEWKRIEGDFLICCLSCPNHLTHPRLVIYLTNGPRVKR